MGSTMPRRVSSPVIARSLRTGMPVSAEMRAVARVMPALGPSLGMAMHNLLHYAYATKQKQCKFQEVIHGVQKRCY